MPSKSFSSAANLWSVSTVYFFSFIPKVFSSLSSPFGVHCSQDGAQYLTLLFDLIGVFPFCICHRAVNGIP